MSFSTGPMKLKVTFKKIGVQSFRFSFDLDSVYKTPNKDEIVYKLGNIEVDNGNIWQLVIIVELIGALQRKFTSKGFHILRRKPRPTKHEAQGRNA